MSIIFIIFFVPFLKSPPLSSKKEIEISLKKVLGDAFKDPNFSMIFLVFLLVDTS